MKDKITFLSVLLVFLSLTFLTLPSFAQQEYEHTESESITCGNGICEVATIQSLRIGEEKAMEIAGKTYNFKLIDITKKENIYTNPRTGKEESTFSYSPTIAVNGEEIGKGMTIEQIREKYGFHFAAPIVSEEILYIKVRENEVEGCAVPDCAFKVELNIYKKWNLVPIWLLGELLSETAPELRKGTCKLQDFLVIYGFDPIEKDYVKLHSYRKSVYDLQSSVTDFGKRGGNEKIFVGTPFNSVWVYSLSECKLVAEMPTGYKNLLLIIEYLKEQEMASNFASGWNFWAGSADTKGKSFGEIKGDCSIEKAYTFEAQSQSWKKLESPPGPEINFLFKVKDSCTFGTAEAAPPELPE